MQKTKIAFSAKRGFEVLSSGNKSTLVCPSLSKITFKFADTLNKSPYFAAFELDELRQLSSILEREQLKKRPHYEPLVRAISEWFGKSHLRQTQIKEWLRTAPELFISDVIRSRDFNLLQKGEQRR